jgi:hypothetical protein
VTRFNASTETHGSHVQNEWNNAVYQDVYEDAVPEGKKIILKIKER